MHSHIFKPMIVMAGILLGGFLLFGFLYPLHYAVAYRGKGVYQTDNLKARYITVTAISLFGKKTILDRENYSVTGIHGNHATVCVGKQKIPVKTTLIAVADIPLVYRGEVYQGDTLDAGRVSGTVTFRDGKTRKMDETFHLPDTPVTGDENICVRTSYGLGILKIRPVMVKNVLLRDASA